MVIEQFLAWNAVRRGGEYRCREGIRPEFLAFLFHMGHSGEDRRRTRGYV